MPRKPLAAVVGRQQITLAEYRKYLRYSEQYYSRQGSTTAVRSDLSCRMQTPTSACTVLQRQVLRRLIEEHAVLNYAAVHHIELFKSDRDQIRVELDALDRGGALKNIGVSTDMMRSVLERQIMVRKVEGVILPDRAIRGPSFHIVKYVIPKHFKVGGLSAFDLSLRFALQGGKPPPRSLTRIEWIAPFRLSSAVRRTLEAAGAGEYVGPFRHRTSYEVFKLLGRTVHTYGAPARDAIETRYFHTWLDRELKGLKPRCFSSAEKPVACPN